MPKGKEGKPKGRMTPYAFFIQTIREEHRKKYPGEQIVFADFSKKCAEKWKLMNPKDKRRFEELAEKDKSRYDREMSQFSATHPGEPVGKGSRKRKNKDPNAPKRALSAFFFFCNEERAAVKKQFPEYMVGDIAKELGKRWEKCTERPRFEAMAQKDKKRYEQAMTEYRKGGAAGGSAPKKAKAAAAKHDTEEEDDEEEEEDDDDDDE